MRHFATLLTDYPLDEARLRGLLLDLSSSALSGAILPRGLEAVHSFGEAELDAAPRDVLVRVRPGGTAHPAALAELRKAGFVPRHALEFLCAHDERTEADAWALVRLYADELAGWILTEYLTPDEVESRQGSREGLLPAPLGSHRKPVTLLASSALRQLAP